jgi:transposase
MFFPEDRVRVWLYARPTDMRKQFDGLAALARNQLGEDPISGHLFVFINRRRTYMRKTRTKNQDTHERPDQMALLAGGDATESSESKARWARNRPLVVGFRVLAPICP